ncbi:Translocation protein sec66 [Neolecta irregularis DAH-3]|uniref:Translocation protein sec66 n=1 Tax=Neolecta irregularis (strain DAH-3) TaxID=1198029 RepID=A0A1U7LLK5_NEOID|nr:Translocation protein sec66 [Neolecta irregularis DAH-3]|eukprot:OLL23422.1 Translocation protein sec66 [Neolecta irregularis DAH-3]
MATSVFVPIIYVIVLISTLAVFSHFYRRRKDASQLYEPWFPTHRSRDLYLSLLHQEPSPPSKLLKAALLRRAVEDVRRLQKLREGKQALQTLLQSGSIGDHLWTEFQIAEKQFQAELMDVVAEANAMSENWGQTIFGTASEILQHDRIKESLNKIKDISVKENQRIVKEKLADTGNQAKIAETLEKLQNGNGLKIQEKTKK